MRETSDPSRPLKNVPHGCVSRTGMENGLVIYTADTAVARRVDLSTGC